MLAPVLGSWIAPIPVGVSSVCVCGSHHFAPVSGACAVIQQIPAGDCGVCGCALLYLVEFVRHVPRRSWLGFVVACWCVHPPASGLRSVAFHPANHGFGLWFVCACALPLLARVCSVSQFSASPFASGGHCMCFHPANCGHFAWCVCLWASDSCLALWHVCFACLRTYLGSVVRMLSPLQSRLWFVVPVLVEAETKALAHQTLLEARSLEVHQYPLKYLMS